MTSEQMFYGVSIPIVVFLISTFLSNRSLSIKIDGLSVRLDGVDGRLDRVDSRLDRVDGRLDRLETSITFIQNDLRTFHHVTGKLEGRIDEISKQ
jgi:archaellum component FlaC